MSMEGTGVGGKIGDSAEGRAGPTFCRASQTIFQILSKISHQRPVTEGWRFVTYIWKGHSGCCGTDCRGNNGTEGGVHELAGTFPGETTGSESGIATPVWKCSHALDLFYFL